MSIHAGQKRDWHLWRYNTDKKENKETGAKVFTANFKKAPFALAAACSFIHIMLAILFAYYKITPLFITSFISMACYLLIILLYARLPELLSFLFEYILILTYCIEAAVITRSSAGTEFFSLGMVATVFLFTYNIPHPKWFYPVLSIPPVLLSVILVVFFPIHPLPAPEGFYFIHKVFSLIGILIAIIYICIKLERDIYSANKKTKETEEALIYTANHDPLTKLINRRRLWEHFHVYQDRKELYNSDYSICIFDIDNFKKLNDTFGHDCGDMILHDTSQLIHDMIPANVKLGRWGGEEFVLLFPRSTPDVVQDIEEIRKTIADNHFIYEGKALAITLTFGIASSKGCSTIKEMLIEADAQLMKGKNNGKNQVVYNFRNFTSEKSVPFIEIEK